MNAFADTNKIGKDNMDNALRSISAVTKGFQQIAAETTEFTKKSYEQSAQMFERLAQVRTLDKAIELQSEYARSAYEAWVSQANKMGEIYTEIAREAYRPIESSVQQNQQYAQNMANQAN
ncbi:phasin family protein [Aureimonas sp. SK2]|uniref:phasin family protein n=1 Tax=Aureimonas sp. SK2 TaxID=3015992 RepID=UPI00244388D6|nr:phasin family protein [Aureimonas sp. SK2]